MTTNTADGWPFWAPTRRHITERALDLAGVQRGQYFVDLGCGDGRVLVAAARRGAQVTGIECDAGLAADARQALARARVVGEVVEADLFDPTQSAISKADVLFTYLSAATLQRLVPSLQRAAPGTRLVAVDFPVPGLRPAVRRRSLYLYELPAPPVPPGPPGWPSAGALVAIAAECESLTCLEIRHTGGPVDLSATATLAESADCRVGTEHARTGEAVAIDLRWRPLPSQRLVSGRLSVGGLPPHRVFALPTEEPPGMWELDGGGCANLERWLHGRHKAPTIDDLLHAAEGADP